MADIDEAEPRAAAALSVTDREAWAIARRRIEHSRHWVSPEGRRTRWEGRAFGAALQVFALGMRISGLYGWGRRNALTPELVELDLFFPKLPDAFDGYRVLHISDTHLDILPGLASVARGMLAGVEVDLLALTGDVLGWHRAPLAAATGPLAEALDGLRVRDRRLAVLGNHDPAEMAEALEDLGFGVLLNESVPLKREGERILVTGLDDVHSFYTEAAHAALFDGGDDFRIALVHSPEMADYAARAGIALYLCGHTHGGQICLPDGRALFTRLTRCRHAAVGLWRHGATQGYTSRGLGSSGPPLRFNSRGEMTVITLRKAHEDGL
jgi:uncharacterized protein